MTQGTFAAQATDPQANAAAQDSAAQNPVTQSDQSVALIVGERAFATMEDVKTKIVNADTHIGNIETENATLRAQLEEANTKLAVSESLEQVLQNKESNKDEGLTLDQIDTRISDGISLNREAEIKASNQLQCNDAVVKAYGENFIEKLQGMATDLGLSMIEVDTMAQNNPRLFTKTFIPITIPSGVPDNSSHTSTIRTSNFQETSKGDEIKPVFSLTSKQRTAQYLKQLEALK